MSLPQPTAVAAAISGGVPTDVREWIVVDIVGSPSAHRRGYAVFTEPLDADGHTNELAHQVRDVLLHELRLHSRQPADAALSRAFAVANSIVYDDARINGGKPRQIGASAIIFEGYTATIAHVPPGQIVLVQDDLVYSVPELDSRLSHWAVAHDPAPTPEPFGFDTWTAPLLVQTELMPGDAIVISNDATGTVLAKTGFDLTADGMNMRRFHGLDPDDILDTIRDGVVDAGEPFAAIAVISFPPNPVTSEIETFGDIGRNAREQLRHTRAAVRSVTPKMPSVRKPRDVAEENEIGDAEAPVPDPPKPQLSLQERILRITEGRPGGGRSTWKPRRLETQFGAPGAHGVRKHSRITSEGPAWRSGVPRAPFLSNPVFIGVALLAVFLLGMLVWSQRDTFLPDDTVYVSVLAQVDQRLAVVDGSDDPDLIRKELDAANDDLNRARDLGAPGDEVSQREAIIVAERDEVNSVYRVSGVRRIGSLPDDLRDGETSAFMTSGGIFLANGSLYRLNPDTTQMQMMLEEGREIEGVRVGPLFGVAYDGNFLVTTDGRALFFASSTDGAIWQSMTMEQLNNNSWPNGAIAAFNENMYLLVPDYRNIYAFETDANIQTVAPLDWVSVGDRINLDIAVDMTIDGNIYVLLEDGQVITYRSGLEIDRFDLPGFDLANDIPVAIVSGAATGYLYIAVEDDNGGGRIIAIDRDGQKEVVLELPDDFGTGDADVQDPFENLQDIVVDEQSGTMYLINGDAVWSFLYTLPVLPDQGGTPEAIATP